MHTFLHRQQMNGRINAEIWTKWTKTLEKAIRRDLLDSNS